MHDPLSEIVLVPSGVAEMGMETIFFVNVLTKLAPNSVSIACVCHYCDS